MEQIESEPNYKLNNKFIWNITSSGKFQYFLIVTGLTFLFFSAFIIHKTEGSLEDLPSRLLSGLFVFSLILIVWIATYSSIIIKLKIPKEVSIDTELKKITLKYPNKELNADLSSLSFSLKKGEFHGNLTLHKKIRSKRGHTIYKEFTNIFSLKYGKGWKMDQLQDISEVLLKFNVEERA